MPVLEQVNLSGRVSHRAIYIYIYVPNTYSTEATMS
jgi:hypothetical protein